MHHLLPLLQTDTARLIAGVIIAWGFILACILRALRNCRQAEEDLCYERRSLAEWAEEMQQSQSSASRQSILATLSGR